MPSLSFVFATLFLLSSCFSSLHSFQDDGQSLLAFKKLITSDPHQSMADWSDAITFCNWTAVTCSRRHPNRVVSLNLTAMDLRGPISPSLANLSFLRSLDLSVNALHGHISTRLGRLFRLRVLWLHQNQLEGNIPSQLSSCRKLVRLSLSFNNLSGNIPPELGSLAHLAELFLGSNELVGTIPSSLGNLSKLTHLNIEINSLTGAIPPQLGLLTILQNLYLHTNELSGIIPTSLSNISTLIYLELANNKLNGPIPYDFGLLLSLQTLSLYENELSSTIPSSLSNISTLIVLGIGTNKFSGTIPQELGLLTHLQLLYLYENKFSGTIPSSLSNISTLTVLKIGTNKLTGTIPQELGLITHLQVLSLYENELSGTIPTSLSNISTLTTMVISENRLIGYIPSEFGAKLNNLSILGLWGNQLSGNIPISLGNCSKLKVLILGENKFSGNMPIELGKLSLLEHLDLSTNEFENDNVTTILVALTNCSHLQQLLLEANKLGDVLPLSIGYLSTNLSLFSLASNRIQGNIPPIMGNLSSLTYLDLSQNLLKGNIPQLRSLKIIERLYLSYNRLEGNIPNDFVELSHLGLLDISKNRLSGVIPNSLASLKQLRRVLLHHNQLSGDIPTNLGNCINLELLDLSHNMLNGTIPREIANLYNLQFYLNLSWNLFEGFLPMEIGKIAMAQTIDISSNQLTGVIPTTIGSCSELQALNLSQNFFQGSIPDSLGKLQSLMNLDLSSNSLSGTIPVTLEKLKMLKYLNLSFNNLTGKIPKGDFFANQTIAMFFIGNPNLCGPQIFNLSACPIPKSHFASVKKLALVLSGAIAFILICLLLAFLWRRNTYMQNFDFSQVIFQKLVHQRISYQELHIATNGFAEANLLGKGSFGLVYKGVLSDGSLVAVKVLQLQKDQVEKSFKAECSILQKVRHRNLVRVITSCSNIQFKGLVLPFMSNGSLEKHLYPDRDRNNGEDVCELGLKTLLDIAIDVAHAMEYLHHDSFVQIVHCDIKPSNVLLDEDMSGHVTYFGIARIIGATSTDSLTSTLTLKGSVGYIAPEYGLGEAISTKGDVYSYGIMLLEMLTRKRPTSEMFVGDLNLHKWVNLAFPNRAEEVIDSSVFREVDGDEFEENNIYTCLLSLLHVGLLCSKDSSEERPIMRNVVMVLKSIKEDLIANALANSKGLRRSISSLLSNATTTRNDALASTDESSSTL